MNQYRIAVIPGDGIGVDVVEEGLKVLKAAVGRGGFRMDFTELPWSTDYYFKHGEMMPKDGIETLRKFDAIFLGAVGHPKVQDHITLNGLLLPIRRSFDQYICERPSVLYPGVKSPLAGKKPWDIDLVVIRENTEGEYANVGGFQYRDQPEEVAVQTSVFTRRGCERVITYAFELAGKRAKKKHVTSITKSNAQGYGMVLWDRTFRAVAERHPDIRTDSLLIDRACMDFIRRPEQFDVVVASNLFGDILTDIGAVITGSLGLASSANIDPTRRNPSMFEPTHGSAPDIAGKGIANPMAQILTAGLMLRHLGQEKAAQSIDAAVQKVLYEGKTVSPDLGGSAKTAEVGDAIVAALGSPTR
jgi:tartrate dehydrogenase/decarboxylase/D-malate dehydrogenase